MIRTKEITIKIKPPVSFLLFLRRPPPLNHNIRVPILANNAITAVKARAIVDNRIS